jgi:large subunit ribosomal protein L13
MDMNKAFFLKKEQEKPRWKVIDARGQVLGRLATEVADILRGKHVPEYTPHSDAGDYVVIVNADQIVLSGSKWTEKTYDSYSGWIGGLKTATARELGSVRVIELAIQRMLPKSKMGKAVIKKLRIYKGAEHPHHGQVTA